MVEQSSDPHAADRGRLAYEERWRGHKLGPCGASPAWDDLGDEGRAVWQRIADKLDESRLPVPSPQDQEGRTDANSGEAPGRDHIRHGSLLIAEHLARLQYPALPLTGHVTIALPVEDAAALAGLSASPRSSQKEQGDA